jgi:hypothetical protein
MPSLDEIFHSHFIAAIVATVLVTNSAHVMNPKR